MQVHNAEQLADWCLSYLSQCYNTLCRRFPKVLRNLHPENQAWLNVHRWPPVWYLKDVDIHQRLQLDRERERQSRGGRRRVGGRAKDAAGGVVGGLKRARSNSGSGCLCFTSGKSSRQGYY